MSEFRTEEERLARILESAGGLKLIRIGWLERNRVVMTFDWQGEELQFTTLITEILRNTLPKNPRHRVYKYAEISRRSTRVYKSRSYWTEWELRKFELPLYWNEEWLSREFKRLGSFTAIHKEFGYSDTNMGDHANRHFKWRIKPRRGSAKQVVIETWLRSGRKAKLTWLRDQFGVALGSVHNWIEQYKEEERKAR